jgi:alkane 1-monooxygenase
MTSWREKPEWYWLSSAIPVSAIVAIQFDHPWSYLLCLIAAILIFDRGLGQHVEAHQQQIGVTPVSNAVPVVFICAWLLAVLAATSRISHAPVPEFAGLMVVCGVLSAFTMAHIHEVMHRDSRLGKRASDVAMTLAGYPHYRLVHELHHAHLGDPQFGSTAHIGVSLWRHVGCSFGRSSLAVLAADRQRLAQGRSVRLPFPVTVWFGILFVFASVGGVRGLAFYLGQSAISVFVVETIGYIQHYGLVGGVGPVAWNVRSWLSNRLFVNNGLHTHHHLEQTLSYERLQCVGATLPAGYMHMFLLALVPPLWFSVMNRHPEMPSRPHSTVAHKNQESTGILKLSGCFGESVSAVSIQCCFRSTTCSIARKSARGGGMSDIVRSQCRLPKELNDWLAERAKHESRSKNAQLIVELRARRAEFETNRKETPP